MSAITSKDLKHFYVSITSVPQKNNSLEYHIHQEKLNYQLQIAYVMC